VAQSALLRQESRGAHYNLDHPESGPTAVATVLRPAPRAAHARRRAAA
jgi:L-aspartate oxidase